MGKRLPGRRRGRPAFRPRLIENLRLEQHVPEALRPFQIDRQEQAAQADEREGDQVAGAGQRVIFLVARQVDEGGDEVRTRGDAAPGETVSSKYAAPAMQ